MKLGQDSTMVGEKIEFSISERPRNALDIYNLALTSSLISRHTNTSRSSGNIFPFPCCIHFIDKKGDSIETENCKQKVTLEPPTKMAYLSQPSLAHSAKYFPLIMFGKIISQ